MAGDDGYKHGRALSYRGDDWRARGGTSMPERRAPSAGDVLGTLLGLVVLAAILDAATSDRAAHRSPHARVEESEPLPPPKACAPSVPAATHAAPVPPEAAFLAVVLAVMVVFLIGWCAALTFGTRSAPAAAPPVPATGVRLPGTGR